MLAWAPERIVVAHGRCYLQDATNELRRAFRWTGIGASGGADPDERAR
jgi:hypothetical protein